MTPMTYQAAPKHPLKTQTKRLTHELMRSIQITALATKNIDRKIKSMMTGIKMMDMETRIVRSRTIQNRANTVITIAMIKIKGRALIIDLIRINDVIERVILILFFKLVTEI